MRHYTKLIRPYLIWSLLIVIIPLVLIVLYSLTTGGNVLVNIKFTFDNFAKIGEVTRYPFVWSSVISWLM